jgi:hypothetical protein
MKFFKTKLNFLSLFLVITITIFLINPLPIVQAQQCDTSKGDMDCNGSIDIVDFSIFIDDYVKVRRGQLDPKDAKGDLNKDGKMGLDDFEVFRRNFILTLRGTGTPTVSVSLTPTSHEGHTTVTPTNAQGGTQTGTLSMAMGKWTPSKWDTCTQAEHDNYFVLGPDGKKYPTWHAPTHKRNDGTTCTFGHEHGRDPRTSALWPTIQQQYAYDANKNNVIDASELAASGIPFGYANEKLDEYNLANNITNGMRHEDHVGNKIMWENNVQRDQSVVVGGSNRKPIDLYCDMFMAVHQGTHSKDAFTNNLHEVKYFIDCNKGSLAAKYPVKMSLNMMVAFGKPGGFSVGSPAGGFTFQQVGPATPANSPAGGEPGRAVPHINRVTQFGLVPNGSFSSFSEAIYEDWISGNHITTTSGKELAYFDPHFAVFSPSRFFWSGSDANTYGITRTTQDKTENMGRSIDICYMKETNGDRAKGGECDGVTNYKDGSTIPVDQRITFDNPKSPFNGCKREFYFNNNGIYNSGGPAVWYTDPYGKKAQTTPFPGSIKQSIASVNSDGLGMTLESIALGKDINWCGTGVHAPN